MTNQEAFLKSYDEHADAIYRYCFFRVFDQDRAQDTVQETYLRTWEYLSRGNKIRNPKAFLYRTARNLIIDQSRKKREISLDELIDQGFDPGVDNAERADDILDARAIASHIQQLEPLYREAVTLRYINELRPQEIADILDESENVISVRVNRGINMLRKILNT